MNRICLILIGALITIARPILANPPQEDPSLAERVVQRAAEATTSDDWTEGDWDDEQLESWLSAVIDDVQRITKNNNIELPTTFDDVRPAISPDGSHIAHLNNGLFVTKRGTVSHAHDSIIIADESIEVSHAHNCLIIARGAVDVGHGRGNVIIAGHCIHTSYDGYPEVQNPVGSNGSVLICGSVVDVAHAKNTIVCAPQAATMSFTRDVTFINSPNRNVSHERDSTYLTDDSGILPTNSPKHPMIDELKITRIVPPDDSGNGAMVTTEHTDEATEIRIDEAIPGATAELEGWKLVFVGEGFALFAKDGQFASAYITPSN